MIYCLIYLNDIVIFSHTAEEHLYHLHVVFNWFREHNLTLKPLKCNFFGEEISYLAHQISTDGVQPSNSNLKAIAECTPPKTYTGVCAFLGDSKGDTGWKNQKPFVKPTLLCTMGALKVFPYGPDLLDFVDLRV